MLFVCSIVHVRVHVQYIVVFVDASDFVCVSYVVILAHTQGWWRDKLSELGRRLLAVDSSYAPQHPTIYLVLDNAQVRFFASLALPACLNRL